MQQGRFTAKVRDDLTQTHNRQIDGLIAGVSTVAAKAQESAFKAAAAAARASNDEAAANDAAASAQRSANDAAGYARDAKASADAADSSANQAMASAKSASSAAAAAERDAIDAQVSARLAQSSYAWARASSVTAHAAADDAYKAALSAGEQADLADQAKWNAFGSYVELYRREAAQRLVDEEERLRKEAEKKKRICVPGTCATTAFLYDDDVEIDYKNIGRPYLEVLGIPELKECAYKREFESCAWAAVAFIPVPVGKAAKYFGKALREGSKGFTGSADELLGFAARNGDVPDVASVTPSCRWERSHEPGFHLRMRLGSSIKPEQ